MHIPIKPESADDFIERVSGLLQDKRTHVYFDTSFLMWLTTIGPASRKQFLAWTETLGDRTHVPLWSMHEYYRHHRNQTLKRRLEKSSRKLDAAVKAFISDVGPYADRPLLPGQPDRAYLEALRLAARRLEELTSLAETWDYDEAPRKRWRG
jgi:predicted nucleic acid-binding protein